MAHLIIENVLKDMTDKEKIIKELKEALDSLDITNKYRLNLIRAIEYLQEEPVSENLEEAVDDYTSKVLERTNCLIGNQPVGEEISEAVKFGANWQKEQMLKKVKKKLLNMLQTSVDNQHFFEQLDEYIDELENKQ